MIGLTDPAVALDFDMALALQVRTENFEALGEAGKGDNGFFNELMLAVTQLQ